jgi:glycine cleavage system regulatory protein
LGFIVVTDADASGLVATTTNFLKNLGIDIKQLRGQGYDGASVMSGIRGGVQKLIKDM